MNSKLYFLIALLGVLFYSCENVVNEPVPTPASARQAMVTVIDTVGDVTADVARYVAESYAKTAQTRNSVTKKIKEIIPVNGEKGVASLYIVNYENNQGYLILSGVNECQPVLAYNNQGYFDIEKSETDGTSIWLQEQIHMVEKSSLLPDSIRIENKRAWNVYFKKEKNIQLSSKVATKTSDSDLEYEIGAYIEETLNQWGNEGYTIYSYNELGQFFSEDEIQQINSYLASNAEDRYLGGYYGTVYIRVKNKATYTKEVPQLLQSKWGQSGGYAAYTPNHYPAGCVSVAIAQIMRYHKYPVLYNWNGMAYLYSTDLTARLLAEIGVKTKTKYSEKESTAAIDDACRTLEEYGYAQSKIVEHTELTDICGQLDNHNPVYMVGVNKDDKGHAWVCDGYSIHNINDECEVMAIDKAAIDRNDVVTFSNMYYKDRHIVLKYYHMNWGWNGSRDGFYTDISYIQDIAFVKRRKDIINIHP